MQRPRIENDPLELQVFLDAMHISPSWFWPILTPGVQDAVEVFALNLNRAVSLCTSLPMWFSAAGLEEHARCGAAIEVIGTIDLPRNPTQELLKQVNEKLSQQRKLYLDGIIRDGGLGGYGEDAVRKMNIMLAGDDENGPVCLSIKAMLSSTIVSLWTACENIATDLWIAAVNHSPSTLGVNALKSPGCNSEEFLLDASPHYNFDLSKSLGTALWSRGPFKFSSLEGIRAAYFETLCHRDKDGKKHRPKEVLDWFRGKDHDQLIVLEAIRNVIVHRGGRVDKPFLDRVSHKNDKLASLTKDTVIVIDGAMIKDYTVVVIGRAIAIAKGVDAWLQKSEQPGT